MLSARSGEQAADRAAEFDEFFARKADSQLARALGLAFYITGDRHEAEDATQEAMTRAWQARGSLRDAGAFDAWIDRIVVNTCRERLRRGRRLRIVDIGSEPGIENRVAGADGVDSLIARDAVERALATLPVDQRAAVVLRYWRDMTLEEIAEHLRWPIGTVKSRLHRALQVLRDNLERDETEVAP